MCLHMDSHSHHFFFFFFFLVSTPVMFELRCVTVGIEWEIANEGENILLGRLDSEMLFMSKIVSLT